MRDQEVIGCDLVLQIRIGLGVVTPQWSADHGDGSPVAGERSGMSCTINALSQAGHDSEVALHQALRYLCGSLLSLRRGLSTPHYGDRTRFRKLPGSLVIKELDWMTGVAQLLWVVASVVEANAEMMNSGLFEPG
ncbi:hypothetical protein D3C80_1324580 [compost metagenome]